MERYNRGTLYDVTELWASSCANVAKLACFMEYWVAPSCASSTQLAWLISYASHDGTLTGHEEKSSDTINSWVT